LAAASVVAFAASGLGTALIVTLPQDQQGSVAIAVLILIMSTLFAAIAVSLRSVLQRSRGTVARSPSIENRLHVVTQSLHEASDVMAALEHELRARQARLESLSREYAQVQRLASVNREAAEAIRQELAEVVKVESRRSFWLSIGVTVASTLPLGVLTGIIAILLVQHITGH
jgi:septal ring factor EnvC (AmiA/AmiB activator)